MKKLISELEKLKGQGYGVNGISRDAAISDCIEIVKSYDPWIDVSEEPPKYDTYLVVTEGNCIDMAHFAMVWSDGRMTSGRPIKWTYLPEAQP